MSPVPDSRFGIIRLTALLTAGGLAVGAAAARPASAALPAAPRSEVSDFAGVIDAGSSQAMTSLIREVREKASAEIAVAAVADLDGSDIETAAVELFQKWGIGRKGKDDGVLILLSVRDRAARIEVGYGLEAVLPDGKAGEIIRERMIPYFKEGAYGQGLLAGTAGVALAIAEGAGITLTGVPDPRRGNARPRETAAGRVMQLLFLAFLAYMFVRHPRALLLFLAMGGGRGGGIGGGGGFGGGFGGFGGGSSGGGGASGRW